MLKIIFGLSLVWFVIHPGQIIHAAPVDNSIETCVIKEDKMQGAPENCIGTVSDACFKDNKMQGSAACFDKEARQWDRFLKQEFKALMSVVGKSVQQKGLSDKQRWLRNVRVKKTYEAQRAWLHYRDTTCQLPGYMALGDPAAQFSSASCMSKTTALRAIYIHNWRLRTQQAAQ